MAKENNPSISHLTSFECTGMGFFTRTIYDCYCAGSSINVANSP